MFCLNHLTARENIIRPTFGIIILLTILTLASCATPTSEFNHAKEINTIDSYRVYVEKYPYGPYTNAAKAKITELTKKASKEIQLKNNWGKLQKGMSVDEVDSLIGPLNRAAVLSIKKLADKYKASASMNGSRNAGGGFPYSSHYFTLRFDDNGRLSEWSLK